MTSRADRCADGTPASNQMTGVIPTFSVALLQRLANPNQPYDPMTNPYVTVDGQAIDLTVFNGEDREPSDWDVDAPRYADDPNSEPVGEFDPMDPTEGLTLGQGNDQPFFNAPPHFIGPRQRGSLERGPLYAAEAGQIGQRRALWGNRPIPSNVVVPELWNGYSTPSIGIDLLAAENQNIKTLDDGRDPDDHYFQYQPGGATPCSDSSPSYETLGRHNQWYDRGFQPNVNDKKPYAWLTWKNGDFTSPLEMILVPSSAPWRLAYEFNFRRTGGGGESGSPYENLRAPFGHLLNFFHSSGATDEEESPDLARIFDFLEVPSPFVGTETWLQNGLFQAVTPPADVNSLVSPFGYETSELRTPFNRLPRFRNPGRVNINTIQDQVVWKAIDPDPTPTSWSRVRDSMIGSKDPLKRPALYSQPFRAAASADLMPLDALKQSPVEATLLRPSPSDPDEPLFSFQLDADQFNDIVHPYNNPEGNAYFRYHKLQRLSNLLTTHSNVYAVWITVGYFELLPWTPRDPLGRVDTTGTVLAKDAIQAAGYELGLELGSDTGQIKRHRAFYIIDRSIPVAFEPGENHNVDRAIRVQRILE